MHCNIIHLQKYHNTSQVVMLDVEKPNSESENVLYRMPLEKWWARLRQLVKTREIEISQIGLLFN